MKRAIIVGSQGQDGTLLFRHLAARGYSILGIGRGGVQSHGDLPATVVRAVDILDGAQVAQVVREVRPQEIYYVAGFHHSAEDRALVDSPVAVLVAKSHEIQVTGLLHFLEAIRQHAPEARLFYAGTSHVFGNPPTPVQDEDTPLSPRCIYGVSKAMGVHCCRFYRAQHGVFASAGILFNHESPLRRPKFLPRKIVRAAVSIAAGEQSELLLGDLEARVDWGYAPDYVDAMQRILAMEMPGDFVVATGEAHSVREFAEVAFAAVGLDWKAHVRTDSSIITKASVAFVGNAARLRAATGWAPTISFRDMVKVLVRAEKEGREAASPDLQAVAVIH